MAGAHVYLLAAASGASGAGQAAYGGAGITASATNQSQSLLTSAGNTTLDTSGGATNGWYYVTTDASGNFSISGDYTCTAGQQVYLYSLGGNAGSGANASAGLLAALGSCPSGGNFLSGSTPVTYVVVNEVSTVAAAYAMAGFATDATHVGSSGTTLALTGIANAFANAGNLSSISTGTALATTPAGNGTAPQAEINTLANMLASCVNSNGAVTGGTTPTNCYTLFTNALSGGATGTEPADTATAAINIAHNPGVNVSALYALAAGTPPFAGGLTSAPNDWTVALSFTGGGLGNPQAIAIDAAGNAWIANSDSYYGSTSEGSVIKLSNTGAVLSGSSGFAASSLYRPAGIAIDKSGDAWVGGTQGPPFVNEFSSTGTLLLSPELVLSPTGSANTAAIDASGNAWFGGGNILSVYTSAGAPTFGSTNTLVNGGLEPGAGVSVAIDGSGDAWVANLNGKVTEVSSSGTFLSGSSGYTVRSAFPYYTGIAVDRSGNVWVAGEPNFGVFELSHTGSLVSPTQGYASGELSSPSALAIDGAGNVWILLNSSGFGIVELSSSGTLLTPAGGYAGNQLGGPFGFALDGSGDVWVTNTTALPNGSVTEFIGLSTPVITPIVAGLPATPTADGSSNLGTRP